MLRPIPEVKQARAVPTDSQVKGNKTKKFLCMGQFRKLPVRWVPMKSDQPQTPSPTQGNRFPSIPASWEVRGGTIGGA